MFDSDEDEAWAFDGFNLLDDETALDFPSELLDFKDVQEQKTSGPGLSLQGIQVGKQPGSALSNEPARSPTSFTLPSSDVSSILASVANYHSSQKPPSSTSSFAQLMSDVSTIMASVANYHANQEALNAKDKSVRDHRQLVKRNAGKRGALDLLREIATPRKDSADSEPTGSKPQIALATLPPRIGSGTTKKQKTSGEASARIAYVVQFSDCRVLIGRWILALENSRRIGRLLYRWMDYPRCFDSDFLLQREPFVRRDFFAYSTYDLNFRIDKDLLQHLQKKLSDAKDLYKEDKHAGDPSSPTPSTMRCEFVVRISNKLRGFSEENMRHLNHLYTIRDKITCYRADMLWLKSQHSAKLPRIPYLPGELRASWERHGGDDPTRYCEEITGDSEISSGTDNYSGRETESDGKSGSQRVKKKSLDISMGARDAIREVLETCSLRTTFTFKSERPHSCMRITVSDIVGLLGRQARLTDTVLMYALRQAAADFGDVHVFESLELQPKMPPETLFAFSAGGGSKATRRTTRQELR